MLDIPNEAMYDATTMRKYQGVQMKHLIELHLHLDGSLRAETLWELAKEQGLELEEKSVEEVRAKMEVPEECKTLEEYLERFALPTKVIQTEAALERVTFELVETLADEGITYAEIRFAPQLHVHKGLTQAQVVEAAIRGAKRGMETFPNVRIGLILCCMRGDTNAELNMETVEVAKQYLGDVVCAVDIAGAESLYPTTMFADLFAKVREYELPMTIHAGEADGPESMKTALSYGTKRIGHGIAAIEDPELIERLKKENITLEICITSNYHTKEVDSIEAHPFRQLFDAGVRVTLNSDNMTCSRVNIHSELDILRNVFHFTEEEIETIMEYAYEARFLKDYVNE